ncbi:TIGR01457 family HAD-type hydrolase [Paenibacillus beijingensis]|uniref:Acid sugar phosphatase n=1 Tax=Paenibacillus beijingensis TaxID=1126833 RepID=A0A0D5NPF6_9BACL|nr:TIGR01457 family HAD-type hydrolase [Paenibacillus beijingensis]AJY77065.1 HAD family hydrolase [Paenibacillus beijingensis]
MNNRLSGGSGKGESRPLKGLLLDLDGTIYHGGVPIPGADMLIRRLNEIGLPYRFVTNNSSAAPETVAKRLQTMGIDAQPQDVCTSAQAAARYVADKRPGARVLVIGESGLRDALLDAGLNVVDRQADVVVQGIDRAFTYEKAAEAVAAILGGADFVMTNPDLLLPTESGLKPGAGSIGAMIAAAGGKKPVVIGKPSSILMDYALAELGMDAAETWVVGDNMATDIAAGKAADCGTILVLTGLTTRGNYEQYARAAGCEPDVICGDLSELMSYISSFMRS